AEVNLDFVEKDFDTLQISIQSLVNEINIRNILEIWAFRIVTLQKICHFVLLLTNMTHICTCLGL
ncbi:12507_t:CDS:1, partial [Cetraspora pellucida]